MLAEPGGCKPHDEAIPESYFDGIRGVVDAQFTCEEAMAMLSFMMACFRMMERFDQPEEFIDRTRELFLTMERDLKNKKQQTEFQRRVQKKKRGLVSKRRT